MKKYEVVEVVEQTIVRERRWFVNGVSEHDAIRQVIDRVAADGYAGERQVLESSSGAKWRVNGNVIEYNPEEAVPEDNELVDTGGGD